MTQWRRMAGGAGIPLVVGELVPFLAAHPHHLSPLLLGLLMRIALLRGEGVMFRSMSITMVIPVSVRLLGGFHDTFYVHWLTWTFEGIRRLHMTHSLQTPQQIHIHPIMHFLSKKWTPSTRRTSPRFAIKLCLLRQTKHTCNIRGQIPRVIRLLNRYRHIIRWQWYHDTTRRPRLVLICPSPIVRHRLWAEV